MANVGNIHVMLMMLKTTQCVANHWQAGDLFLHTAVMRIYDDHNQKPVAASEQP